MAKSFLETIVGKAGIAGEFEELTEVEIAGAVGAPYSPPESSEVYRVVAARTVQLLGSAPLYIKSSQTSQFVLRVPSGVPGTNDAQDGRLLFIQNNGVGFLDLEKSDGTALATVRAGEVVVVLHSEGDVWEIPKLGGGETILRYSSSGGVPGTGTRYLRVGEGVASSSAGDRIAKLSVLIGLSIQVDIVDATRTFDMEFLTDPGGPGETILATLTLLPGSSFESDDTIVVVIPADTEVGARLVRVAGPGGSSDFVNINAHAYLQL